MSSDQPVDGAPEEVECPNCGGTDNQIDENDHRICWDCGARFDVMDDDPEDVALHIGDHVTDRDDVDDPPLVVTGLPLQRAASYDVDIGGDGETLDEYNPEYPAADHVIEVAYAERTDVYLDEQRTYAFPRSRLRLVEPLHDRDVSAEGEASR